MSLLNAQVDTNPSDPLYGTADLSQVYTDTDPRTYELSYYSYMIVPTDTSFGFTTGKGYTLGAFGSYLFGLHASGLSSRCCSAKSANQRR